MRQARVSLYTTIPPLWTHALFLFEMNSALISSLSIFFILRFPRFSSGGFLSGCSGACRAPVLTWEVQLPLKTSCSSRRSLLTFSLLLHLFMNLLGDVG